MRTFNKVCAQGDIYITRVNKKDLPKGLVEVQPEGRHVIVTHSETGHHHVMLAEKAKLYDVPDSDGMERMLVVEEPTTLDHLRSFDTHEPILFDAGVFKIRRQREYTPEGLRRVED